VSAMTNLAVHAKWGPTSRCTGAATAALRLLLRPGERGRSAACSVRRCGFVGSEAVAPIRSLQKWRKALSLSTSHQATRVAQECEDRLAGVRGSIEEVTDSLATEHQVWLRSQREAVATVLWYHLCG
jgi:hypothetical protein